MKNTFTLTPSGHIISIPSKIQDDYSLLLIFPGVPIYGGNWMKTVIPDFIYENYVVVLSKEFNCDYKQVVDESTIVLKKLYIPFCINSDLLLSVFFNI